MKLLRNIVTSLILMLFIISFSVILTLNFRPLFYFDIDHLDIPSLSGMNETDIRANYDALIDYNSMFNHDELKLPTLPMSENGRIHFEEVKDIFVSIEYLLIITTVASAVLTALLILKFREILFLKLTAIFTVIIPSVLAVCISLNWEKAFVTFHHIFFDNDYWLFLPDEDPIINMLPDVFFFHCAAMILLLVILGSLISYIAYRKLKKRI